MTINKNTYVTRPFLPPLKEFEPFLKEIWRSRWLTNNGKFHKQFEEQLANFLGVKYVSLFTNGTLALITALQVLKVTGEVITTPFSFVATTHSLYWNGIRPVFVDIEPKYCNLDPKKIESAITQKTTAILPVHIYGNPCDIDSIKNIAETYGLKVIYDSCHAFGVKKNNISILNYGDLSVLSFHATKVFNTFEGGAIVSHDPKIKKRIDFLKNFGFADEVTVVAPGINAKMNEFQAALGLLQLKYFKNIRKKRRRIAEYYRLNLNDVNGIRFLDDQNNIEHNYCYFPIFIEKSKYGKSRDDLYFELKKNKIYSRRYFYPLISKFPSYRNLPSSNSENLTIAEKIADEILCLPIYPELKKEKLNDIIDLIKKK